MLGNLTGLTVFFTAMMLHLWIFLFSDPPPLPHLPPSMATPWPSASSGMVLFPSFYFLPISLILPMTLLSLTFRVFMTNKGRQLHPRKWWAAWALSCSHNPWEIERITRKLTLSPSEPLLLKRPFSLFLNKIYGCFGLWKRIKPWEATRGVWPLENTVRYHRAIVWWDNRTMAELGLFF